MLSKTDSGGTTYYAWDLRKTRLKQVTLPELAAER